MVTPTTTVPCGVPDRLYRLSETPKSYQLIRLFDVPLVQLEVHLQRPVGNTIQATQVELLSLL